MSFTDVKFILMDIEGTISDIHFVKEVLFPYSAREMRSYTHQHRNDPIVRNCLAETTRFMTTQASEEAATQASEETTTQTNDEAATQASDEAAIQQLLQWIENDVKHPALKTLQGLIWKKGYEDGIFRSHIYADVLPTWEHWRVQGFKLGIYSSGSVAAQKLFFKYSVNGDILPYLSALFDLSVGSKREVSSYKKIADVLKLPPNTILFLSDITEELDSATAAGFQAGHVVRATASSTNHGFDFAPQTNALAQVYAPGTEQEVGQMAAQSTKHSAGTMQPTEHGPEKLASPSSPKSEKHAVFRSLVEIELN